MKQAGEKASALRVAKTKPLSRTHAGILIAAIFISFSVKEASAAFAGGVYINAICDIYDLMQGDLGGLLAAVAGIMALVMAAMGSLRGAAGFVVTAAAAFTISAGVSAWFGDFGCGGNAGGRAAPAGGRSAEVAVINSPEGASLFRESEDTPVAAPAAEDDSSADPFDKF